jgi:hypothetical protein
MADFTRFTQRFDTAVDQAILKGQNRVEDIIRIGMDNGFSEDDSHKRIWERMSADELRMFAGDRLKLVFN